MTRPAEVAYKSWPGTRDQTGYAPPAAEICHTPLPAILPLANGLTKTCGVPEARDVYANQWPSGEIGPSPVNADVFSKGSGALALGWSGSVVSMGRLFGPRLPPGPPKRTNRPSGDTEAATCPR